MSAAVVSAFPGCGKTWLTKHSNGLRISDSDSSLFHRLPDGTVNPNFIDDYIEHIQRRMRIDDIVLVASYKEVRQALHDNGIQFVYVLPDASLENEYLDRYCQRNSSQDFMESMRENWKAWTESLDEPAPIIRLHSGQYLSDVVELLLHYRSPSP